MDNSLPGRMPEPAEKAASGPRKVLISGIIHHFSGDFSRRLEDLCRCIDRIAERAAKEYPGRGLDLILAPEGAVCNAGSNAEERAADLEQTVKVIGAKAIKYHTYIAVGILFNEKTPEGKSLPRNAVALIDRDGKLAGLYFKVHPAFNWDDDAPGVLEDGTVPGEDFPVFQCDFGRVGFLICYDMAYTDGWMKLRENGAELIGIASLSPQTLRPAMFAHLNEYYVFTSTPRNNASVFDPLGFTVDQTVGNEGETLCEIDLSFAILQWSPSLDNGRKFRNAFGDKAGFRYSEREDCGIFWSNDPGMPIGEMVKKLNLRYRNDEEQRAAELRAGLLRR